MARGRWGVKQVMAYPSVFYEPDRPVHGRRNVDLVKMHVQVPHQ